MIFRPLVCATALIGVPYSSAIAIAPPPPPPVYVTEIRKQLLANESAKIAARLANYVADDVQTFVNGKLVASGKADWLRREASARVVRVLAYSEGWRNGGSLLIADETGSTLYQFKKDGKIHAIETLTADGPWKQP